MIERGKTAAGLVIWTAGAVTEHMGKLISAVGQGLIPERELDGPTHAVTESGRIVETPRVRARIFVHRDIAQAMRAAERAAADLRRAGRRERAHGGY